MKRTVLTFLSIFFFVTSIHAQEVISETDLRLKSGLSDRRESIPIVNDNTNELSLFIVDRKTFYLNKFNPSFELIEQQKFERPKTTSKNIIKAITQKDKYLFLLANDRRNQYQLLSFDAAQTKTELLTQPIFTKAEEYVNTFTYQNQICVITLQKNKSKLNIYKVGVDADVKVLQYDFSSVEFFDKNDAATSFYKALQKESTGFTKRQPELEIIETDIPNSLESTSKSKKLYLRDNTAIISIDNGNRYTQLLTLNLDSVDYKIDNIKKPELLNLSQYSAQFIKSNSFLSKDRLYQIVGKKDQMRLFVTDIHSKELVKQLMLQKEDSIPFKNSPIIQEGGYYANYREMEKTQKFLRKIASGNIAVSVKHLQDTINVTLGGVKEVTRGGGGFGAPMMGFGAVGGAMAGVANTFMTPTFNAYYAYTTTKSTRIHCLFDQNLTHVEGEVPKNAFDKIKDLSRELLNEKAETIFRYNGYYIYGYYESLYKKYYLRKYED